MTTELTLADAKRQLEKFEPNFKEMETKTEALIVDTKERQVEANDMIGAVKGLVGTIEDKRVGIYDILYPKESRKIVKQVNELAKTYKTRLQKIVKVLERKYLDYDAKLRREAAEAEAVRLKAQKEARKKIEEASLFVPPGMEIKEDSLPPAPKVENMVSGDSSASYVKKVKSFEIVDFSLIPDEFKLLNDVLVRKEMHKQDRQDIPGIRWTEETQLATRRR